MSANIEVTVGSFLEYNSTGSTYVEIAEVMNFAGPAYKRKSIPLPALHDTVLAKKTGRQDSGEVTLTCGWTKAAYGLLLGLFKANTSKIYRFSYADVSTESFTGRIIAVGQKSNDESECTFDVTIDCSGDTTFSAAA